MLISPGARIGPYEIAAPLGAGGMGEVYRARDPRLGREVAVKILRGGLGNRRRFEVEARAASSLNHPNIVTVFDIGEEEDCPYIVFELLEGESLREQLAAGAMPLRKLLAIAIQIANGLAAAHAHDITHRDLKPENIMVLPDGQVKILDFGLAKSEAVVAGDSETHTAQGMLLGTLAYMSPEQAQGKDLDFRSDQFSFGAILYEMAAGKTAFRRSDRVSTLAAVAREEPDSLATVAPAIPAPVRWVIERCLAKEPAQRYASTADLHRQLCDIRDHLTELSTRETPLERPRRFRKTWLIAPLSLVFLAGAFMAGFSLVRRGTDPSQYRFTPFATEAADETEPAWSPDGKALAYTASVNGLSQVFVRRFESLMPAQVTSAAAACRYPFWTPDGNQIYYWSDSRLWSVAAVGGEPQGLARDVPLGFPPAALSPDGRTLAYFRSEGPWASVVLNGAVYDRAPFPAKFRLTGGMRFSPDGQKLLVWLVRDIESGSELWILPKTGGQPHRIHSPLLAGAFRNISTDWMRDNRRVALAAPATRGEIHIYLLDTETGASEPITTGTGEEREPAISRNGDRMAFASGGYAADLMEAALDGSYVRPLLATPRHQYSADWAPNGWQYAYISDATGVPEIWLRSVSEGWAMPVVRDAPEGQLGYASPRFSPDGQKLAYVRVGAKHMIWITNLAGGVAVPVEQESRDQHAPAWSPDGSWIAYIRYLGSVWEIAKIRSGGGARPVPITPGGAAASKLEWSPSGEWICYTDGEELRAVPSSGGAPILLAKGVATFTFAQEGASVYVVRHMAGQRWELVRVSVPGGVEGRPVALDLSRAALVTSARLHPDGKRLVLAVSTWNRDIWILDGLRGGGLSKP